MNKLNSKRILTIPNIISFLRILTLIPICLFLWNDNLTVVAILIIISILSDFLDGIIARRFNKISELGKVVDPLADKLSFAAVLIILYLKNSVPLWIVIIVIVRDLAIFLSGTFLAGKYKFVTPSNFLGKVTLNVMSVMMIGYIFNVEILQRIFTPLTVIFIILSSFSYSKAFFEKIKNGKLQKRP